MKQVAALLLAAGASRRFCNADPSASTKLTVELDGKPLVRHVAEAAVAGDVRPIVIVTGHARADVEAALHGLAVDFVHNPAYAEGLSTSLRAGLAALPGACDGALVLLGDMPCIGGGLLAQLVAAFAAVEGFDAVVPVHEGIRGNPALLGRRLFPAAAGLTGDEGARRLLARAAVLEVEVADAAVTIDIDDPEALRRLQTG